MSTPVARAPVTFRWTYLGWLICLLVILYAFLVFVGVVPADAKAAFGCILSLALALFFGTLP